MFIGPEMGYMYCMSTYIGFFFFKKQRFFFKLWSMLNKHQFKLYGQDLHQLNSFSYHLQWSASKSSSFNISSSWIMTTHLVISWNYDLLEKADLWSRSDILIVTPPHGYVTALWALSNTVTYGHLQCPTVMWLHFTLVCWKLALTSNIQQNCIIVSNGFA